jgi:hypothetical protein
MAEHEVTRRLPASRDTVFAVVSDSSRLAEWLPRLPDVSSEGDTVSVVLDGEPRQVLFNAEHDQMRAEWSLAGGGGYAGWLQLFDLGDDECDATVHATLIDDSGGDYGLGRHADGAINEALTRLENLLGASKG